MAPQILEKQKYTYKCDIWSLGVIYFELLHGSQPWRGLNEVDLLNNIKLVALKFADCFSAKVVKMVSGMLAIPEEKRAGWDDVFTFFGLEGPVLRKDASGNLGVPVQLQLPMTPTSSKSVGDGFLQNQPPPPALSPRQMPSQQQNITADQLINQYQLQQQQLQQQLYMQQQKTIQQQQQLQQQQQMAAIPLQQPPYLQQPSVSPPMIPQFNKPINVFFFE